MEKLLFDPGMLPVKELIASFREFVVKNELTLITNSRRENEYKNLESIYEVVYYEHFNIVSNAPLNAQFLSKYTDIVSTILDDHRTLLIAERVNFIFGSSSIFNLVQTIEKTIYNSLILFQNKEIDTILFQATPHNLDSWVLAKTAEAIGIKVLLLQTTGLPYRFWIVEGLDIQNHVFPHHLPETPFDEYLLNSFIALNKNDYTKAIPEYERKRLDSRKGKYWSWKKEIRDIIKYPKRFITLFTKRKLFLQYKSLSTSVDLSVPYLVFFLHFQPERTSMPEALGFSNQWLIIKMLSNSLPEGWMLYIKEHPSMYTNNLDFRYRSVSFYRDIASLSNVTLVPLDFNTFSLIDNSKGVVTITGKVGVQALIRNKLVLIFGISSYKDFSQVYSIKNDTDLNNFFNNNHFSVDDSAIQTYLQSINHRSVSGISDDSNYDTLNFYDRKNRVEGHIKLLRIFFESKY